MNELGEVFESLGMGLYRALAGQATEEAIGSWALVAARPHHCWHDWSPYSALCDVRPGGLARAALLDHLERPKNAICAPESGSQISLSVKA
jgi:hypothetical protein